MARFEIKMKIARNGWMDCNTFESLLLENVFRMGEINQYLVAYQSRTKQHCAETWVKYIYCFKWKWCSTSTI